MRSAGTKAQLLPGPATWNRRHGSRRWIPSKLVIAIAALIVLTLAWLNLSGDGGNTNDPRVHGAGHHHQHHHHLPARGQGGADKGGTIVVFTITSEGATTTYKAPIGFLEPSSQINAAVQADQRRKMSEEAQNGGDSAAAAAAAAAVQTYTVRLRLRPDLSPSSTAALVEAASDGCSGSIYRNEPSFLLQGVLDCMDNLHTSVVKGECPPGATVDPNRVCPQHDPHCGCHGPIMSPGMVGWAGGGNGPDWFVYTADTPNTGWGHDHTIIGEIADEESADALRRISMLPAAIGGGGMNMLKQKLKLVLSVWDSSNNVPINEF